MFQSYIKLSYLKLFAVVLKGRVMSPLIALVCPCFRKNVIVPSKIILDNKRQLLIEPENY